MLKSQNLTKTFHGSYEEEIIYQHRKMNKHSMENKFGCRSKRTEKHLSEKHIRAPNVMSCMFSQTHKAAIYKQRKQ